MPDFIPRSDTECLAWSTNFVEQVAADPAGFGIQPEYVAELVSTQAAFAAAMAVTTTPGTRTSVAIISKNAARLAMETIIRQTAGRVRASFREDPFTLSNLGLRVGPGRNAARRRIGPPTSRPSVFVTGVLGSAVSVHLNNVDAPSRRGMARDISYATVFGYVGAEPPASIADWRVHRMTSRTDTTLDFGSGHSAGTQVWMCARWANARSQGGPLSAAVQTYLTYAAMNSEIVSRAAA